MTRDMPQLDNEVWTAIVFGQPAYWILSPRTLNEFQDGPSKTNKDNSETLHEQQHNQ